MHGIGGSGASFNRGERLVYDRLPVGNVFLILIRGAYTMIAAGSTNAKLAFGRRGTYN